LIPSRRKTFPGTSDVLAVPDYAEAGRAGIFEYLAERVTFDVLQLDGLAIDSPSLAHVERCFGDRATFRHTRTPRFICPQVELEGDWASLLKRTRRADNFKRRLRQLRSQPGFEYRSITLAASAAFERFLELHEAHWTSRGGSDATGHPALLAFHRDVVERLSKAGLARFDELWVDGACRASIYGLDDRYRYCYYNSGYDPAWRDASPGLVLLGLSMEAAMQRGVKRYDFLRGTESYKFDWATTTRETVCVSIARRRLAAGVFLALEQARAGVRSVAKNLLPAPLAKAARRWQRSRRRARELVPPPPPPSPWQREGRGGG
jgi:CelD/BcsL family acetyltransferase involved in cellulose biosynthesis